MFNSEEILIVFIFITKPIIRIFIILIIKLSIRVAKSKIINLDLSKLFTIVYLKNAYGYTKKKNMLVIILNYVILQLILVLTKEQ